VGFAAAVQRQEFRREELDRSGIATTTDWLRTLPSNFGGGATEDTHRGREASSNTAFGTGTNLRGLGSRATLVLLNGQRLAPSGSLGTFTDIAAIPLAAVDHLELLSDGGSTLVGADAIGGIVNFVLRTDAARPQTEVSWGGLTRGSLGERRFSQSLGAASASGRRFLAVEYDERDAVLASQRQATSRLTQNGFLDPTVLPHQQRWSVVANGEQALWDRASVWADALLMHRYFSALAPDLTGSLGDDGGPIAQRGAVDSGQLSLGFHQSVLGGWNVTGVATYAGEWQRDVDGNQGNVGAIPTMTDLNHYASSVVMGSASASGPFLHLPAGALTLTMGAEFRRESFASEEARSDSGFARTFDASRRMTAGYALATVPLVSADSGAPWLELSAGVREEHYDDVGSACAPQFGFTFRPVDEMAFRAGWAKLFRPPNLPDGFEAGNSSTIQVLPDASAAGGAANALVLIGGNAHLQPERAQTFTASRSPSPPLSTPACTTLRP
jgi:outer membrane receptor protein involved in Fe transport